LAQPGGSQAAAVFGRPSAGAALGWRGDLSHCQGDNGDGWEREGENEDYFHLFSEKRAYPLAINALFYLMSH
jgi:hypothetical protein